MDKLLIRQLTASRKGADSDNHVSCCSCSYYDITVLASHESPYGEDQVFDDSEPGETRA